MAVFHKTSGIRMKDDYSSPFASKELQEVEAKKGAKYPTLHTAPSEGRIEGAMRRGKNRLKNIFKPF